MLGAKGRDYSSENLSCKLHCFRGREFTGTFQFAHKREPASTITLQLATFLKTGVFNFVATCNVIRDGSARSVAACIVICAGSARSVAACRVVCAGSARAVAACRVIRAGSARSVAVCRVVCAGSARAVAACTVIRAGSARSVAKCSEHSFPVPPNYPIFAHCVKRRLINKARRKIR